MRPSRSGGRSKLTIDIEPELRQQIEVAATEHNQSVQDYVVVALQDAVRQWALDQHDDGRVAWSTSSTSSFGRDWHSDPDAIDDTLAAR